MNNNCNISFRLPKNIRDLYQKTYPYTMSRFLLNCLKVALKDRSIFEQIYFYNGDI